MCASSNYFSLGAKASSLFWAFVTVHTLLNDSTLLTGTLATVTDTTIDPFAELLGRCLPLLRSDRTSRLGSSHSTIYREIVSLQGLLLNHVDWGDANILEIRLIVWFGFPATYRCSTIGTFNTKSMSADITLSASPSLPHFVE